jgi:ubiquinone/menaquinone biosynthesis C-methylase UbiE
MENISNLDTRAKNNFKAKFVDPEFVVSQLDVKEGIKIADFGCGSGYFSLVLAKKVGKEGVIYALDILPQRLEAVNSSAKNLNLTNIITKRANLETVNGSGLDDESVDLVIIKDMLFQNRKKKDILIEAKRVLKNGGQILVVEWGKENMILGPERELRMTKEALLEISQQIGLNVLKEIDAGNFNFGVLFIK